MPEIFTVEEINLICIFDTSGRDRLIAELTGAAADFEDGELRELAASVLGKLSKMTGAEFSALELFPEYEDAEV
jgi:hypothetical protein